MSADIIDYFPEIHDFANKAVKDGQKADVIKLYYLMVSEVKMHQKYLAGLLNPYISYYLLRIY